MDQICALYVHDTDDSVALSCSKLTEADSALVVETAHNTTDALSRLTKSTFDCVLSSYELADKNGITLLRRIRDFDPELPFILYAHEGTERIASEAISAGVTDYIQNESHADQAATVAGRIKDIATETPNNSESKVRELTEATEDVLWLITADWEETLFVNSAYSTIWGQSETELRSDPTAFFEAVHPDDLPYAKTAMDRLTDGESIEIELRVNSTEDFERRVLIQAEPVFDENGSVKRIAGVSRDITEQRARQRRLKKEQQMVDTIFNTLPDVLYTFDTQGYLLRWNEQLESETGYSSSEIEGMYVTDFVPADEVETITDSVQEIIEHRRTVTVESAFETKGGERVPFEFTGAPLEDGAGNLRGFTGIGRNIAGRKKRQRRFEAVFNNTYQFTGLMEPDGTILEANQAAAEFAGRDRDKIVGQKIWDAYWFQANQAVRETAKKAVETARNGDLFREQIAVQGANREAIIDFSIRPVTDETGAVKLLVPEGRDITRLSEREQQLRVTSRFLRHNIRNKLTTIQGRAGLVSNADDDTIQSCGTAILQAATELDETAETARDIHDLIEADPTPVAVDLAEQLDQAITTVRDQYPAAELSVNTPVSVEIMSLASLNEALTELLTVLIAGATTDEPTLRIDITQSDTPIIEIATDESCLTPSDQEVLTGDIAPNQIRHARGLGVWYVYWYIWYSGGTITVSEDGKDIRIRL